MEHSGPYGTLDRLLAEVFSGFGPPVGSGIDGVIRRRVLQSLLWATALGGSAYLLTTDRHLDALVLSAAVLSLLLCAAPWHRLPRDAFALVGVAVGALIGGYAMLVSTDFPPFLSLAVVVGAVTVSPRAGIALGAAVAAMNITVSFLVYGTISPIPLAAHATLMVGIGGALPWVMRDIRSAAATLVPAVTPQSSPTGASEYISLLVHEVRNPVVAIGAAGRVLARELGEHPAAKKAAAMATEASQILSLLDGLTDLASLETGRFRLTLRPVDVGALVRESVGAMYIPEHTIVTRGAEVPLMVLGDDRRVRQVIHNLVGNAAKYSDVGTQVEVNVGVSSDRRQAVVEVRDHGQGIPPSERWRLFEKFSRLTTAGGTRGTGLGLYISRSIIRDHGGEMWVDFPADGGSQFSFSVPLLPATAAVVPAAPAIATEADRTRDAIG